MTEYKYAGDEQEDTQIRKHIIASDVKVEDVN